MEDVVGWVGEWKKSCISFVWIGMEWSDEDGEERRGGEMGEERGEVCMMDAYIAQ